jgi:predicted transcriptional regulator
MPKSKLDFLAHVLETARNGITREQIASQTDMPHELVDNSLSLLKDLSLLTEKHNSPIAFVTTGKGLQFLHDYDKLAKQIGSDSPLK